MILTIASGKGGTGKTTLAVNLFEFLKEKSDMKKQIRLLDCDVEAPNDNLFLDSELPNKKIVFEKKPKWIEENCVACGKCKEVCHYNAIAKIFKNILIFKDLCHSCGACSYICQNNAIKEEDYAIGQVFSTSEKSNPFLAYGLLNIGETAAPSLVRAVKKNIDSDSLNIIDAPPGTGCSVVSALDGSDISILVTEPTPFGLHDLKLAVELTYKMKIPTGIVINRSDGNDSIILDFLSAYKIPLLGRIPFDRKYAEAYSKGEVLVNVFPEIKQNIAEIYENALKLKNNEIDLGAESVLEEFYCKTEEQQVNNNKACSGKSQQTAPKEIMIVSGKGGTGKTTVSAGLAVLAGNDCKDSKIFADCDVDAADLHLLLKPEVYHKNEFSGGTQASIKYDDCIACGKCLKYCRFDAVIPFKEKYKIDTLKCEGCGVCLLVCPVKAVSESEEINGNWYLSDTEHGKMVHARLGIAEENSGKLVSAVRTNAAKLAEKENRNLIIGDGPPGTGCPVIASVTGIDTALVITEPTVSGIHDMTRILKLIKHFNVNAMVVINKADLNLQMVSKIRETAKEYDAEVIAEIPFDRAVNDALVAGKTIIEYGKGTAYREIQKIWEKLNC